MVVFFLGTRATCMQISRLCSFTLLRIPEQPKRILNARYKKSFQFYSIWNQRLKTLGFLKTHNATASRCLGHSCVQMCANLDRLQATDIVCVRGVPYKRRFPSNVPKKKKARFKPTQLSKLVRITATVATRKEEKGIILLRKNYK